MRRILGDNALFWAIFYVSVVLGIVVSVWDIDTRPLGPVLETLWDWAHDPTPVIDSVRAYIHWALAQ